MNGPAEVVPCVFNRASAVEVNQCQNGPLLSPSVTAMFTTSNKFLGPRNTLSDLVESPQPILGAGTDENRLEARHFHFWKPTYLLRVRDMCACLPCHVSVSHPSKASMWDSCTCWLVQFFKLSLAKTTSHSAKCNPYPLQRRDSDGLGMMRVLVLVRMRGTLSASSPDLPS